MVDGHHLISFFHLSARDRRQAKHARQFYFNSGRGILKVSSWRMRDRQAGEAQVREEMGQRHLSRQSGTTSSDKSVNSYSTSTWRISLDLLQDQAKPYLRWWRGAWSASGGRAR
ncbi:MAG: hypothetical protein ACPIOQ_65645 [Promethearchaeia archaeon]